MSMYVETSKPTFIADATESLYYMSSNSHDSLGVGFTKITTDMELEVAYKVYRKLQDDVDNLTCRNCDGTGLFYQIEDCKCPCVMTEGEKFELAK